MSPAAWIALLLVAADLDGVTVAVDVEDGVTRVEAVYRLSAEGEVRFRARRIAEQELRWSTEGPTLEELAGALCFDSTAEVVTLLYELRGERGRVPLFVPDAVPVGPIEIRLRGLEGDLALRDAFPRLEPAPDGDLVARPANLPSFVRLPPERGPLTIHRASEAVVVLLVVLSTAGWIARRRLFSKKSDLGVDIS